MILQNDFSFETGFFENISSQLGNALNSNLSRHHNAFKSNCDSTLQEIKVNL